MDARVARFAIRSTLDSSATTRRQLQTSNLSEDVQQIAFNLPTAQPSARTAKPSPKVTHPKPCTACKSLEIHSLRSASQIANKAGDLACKHSGTFFQKKNSSQNSRLWKTS
jgi:hypothetical protein